MNAQKAKYIFKILPENEKLLLIEKVMPESGKYRQLDNCGDWSDIQWKMLAEHFFNSIDWDRGLLMEDICIHDKIYIVSGESDLGNKYEGIGFYSDDSLLFIDDLEYIKKQ